MYMLHREAVVKFLPGARMAHFTLGSSADEVILVTSVLSYHKPGHNYVTGYVCCEIPIKVSLGINI
jgi:hypothetical protein